MPLSLAAVPARPPTTIATADVMTPHLCLPTNPRKHWIHPTKESDKLDSLIPSFLRSHTQSSSSLPSSSGDDCLPPHSRRLRLAASSHLPARTDAATEEDRSATSTAASTGGVEAALE
eukprot:GHVU01191510.1.p1 GENE.GHVU01191510.1~~GHVU01191510.1.p1  ORF type:complete len:118 (-),score=16.21 GHVU01191510.1:1336-1689(-)